MAETTNVVWATLAECCVIQQTKRYYSGFLMRFAVLAKGVLRGMGREAGCEILATKTILPEASRAVYSHCAVISAPSDLPNGDYEVEFAGEVAVTTLRDGSWVVGRILPRTLEEAAAFYGCRPVEPPVQPQNVERKTSQGASRPQAAAEGSDA
jgi:hypothetical protein